MSKVNKPVALGINKPVAYDSLMEQITEMAADLGGWDDKKGEFKPKVAGKMMLIRELLQQAMGLDADELRRDYLRAAKGLPPRKR